MAETPEKRAVAPSDLTIWVPMETSPTRVGGGSMRRDMYPFGVFRAATAGR